MLDLSRTPGSVGGRKAGRGGHVISSGPPRLAGQPGSAVPVLPTRVPAGGSFTRSTESALRALIRQ